MNPGAARGDMARFNTTIRQHLRFKQFYGISENAVKTQIYRGVGLRAGRHRQEATPAGGVALHIAAGPFGHSIRENADPVCAFSDTRRFDDVEDSNQFKLFTF
jgi:hypothetical protein